MDDARLQDCQLSVQPAQSPANSELLQLFLPRSNEELCLHRAGQHKRTRQVLFEQQQLLQLQRQQQHTGVQISTRLAKATLFSNSLVEVRARLRRLGRHETRENEAEPTRFPFAWIKTHPEPQR